MVRVSSKAKQKAPKSPANIKPKISELIIPEIKIVSFIEKDLLFKQ
jgi:hypothetical protein